MKDPAAPLMKPDKIYYPIVSSICRYPRLIDPLQVGIGNRGESLILRPGIHVDEARTIHSFIYPSIHPLLCKGGITLLKRAEKE